MKKLWMTLVIAAFAVGLSSCSSIYGETDSKPLTTLSEQEPPEWTDDDKAIWKFLSEVYPEIKVLDLEGKRALLSMPHDICLSYDEGYTRKEIAQVMVQSGSANSAFNDDLMTLGVTYFCPQYMDAQLK